MNIRKIISEEVKRVFSENYPLGAEFDSRAPWNQVDKTRVGDRAENISYKLLWTDESEFAIFSCPQGICVMYIDSIDRDELEPYADREEIYHGKDEDGMPEIEYGEWEITEEVIENYVNDNLESMRIGKGLSDYESGNYDLVVIDDELRQELMGVAKYIKNERSRESFINVLNGRVDESGLVDKIANKKVMDTPTGNLFIMNVSESLNKDGFDTDARIIEVIKDMKKKGIEVTVDNIVIQSLFTNGGTLAGYEDDIKRVLSEFKNNEFKKSNIRRNK